MLDKRIVPLLVAGIWLSAVFPGQAGTVCEGKLAEIDQRMAASELDVNLRNAVTQFRDQAATMCEQGNDAAAMQTLGMVELMLPPPQAEVAAQQQAAADSKAPLTDEFLAGRWCSVTGDERLELEFHGDGTFEPCLPDSMARDYVCTGRPQSTAEWIAGYHSAASIGQDEIVFTDRRGRSGDTFKRGRCSKYGR